MLHAVHAPCVEFSSSGLTLLRFRCVAPQLVGAPVANSTPELCSSTLFLVLSKDIAFFGSSTGGHRWTQVDTGGPLENEVHVDQWNNSTIHRGFVNISCRHNLHRPTMHHKGTKDWAFFGSLCLFWLSAAFEHQKQLAKTSLSLPWLPVSVQHQWLPQRNREGQQCFLIAKLENRIACSAL